EVMAIDRSLEGSLLKAIRSLEIGLDHIELKKIAHESMEQLIERLHLVDLPRATKVPEPLPPQEDYTFEGYRNADGSVGTKN
ncbi:Carbamoyl-phosphate synthase large chain, partial [human gut metagenome]